MGASGAGKSTLLDVLAQRIPPSQARVSPEHMYINMRTQFFPARLPTKIARSPEQFYLDVYSSVETMVPADVRG